LNIKYYILFFLSFSFPAGAQSIIGNYIDLDNPSNVYSFETWTTDNGLPQNSINSIMQGSDGYIWLATFNGLVRFDGQTFKIFNQTNTDYLNSDRIISTLSDSENREWIATEQNGLLYIKDGKTVDVVKKYNLTTNYHHFLRNTSRGEVFFNTQKSIARLSGDSLITYDFSDLADVNTLLTIFHDTDNTLYFCFNDATIRLVDGKLEKVEKYGDLGIFFMYRTRDDRLWLGTEKGLFWKNGSRLVPIDELNRVISRGVFQLYEDNNGVLWIGTLMEGLYFYKSGKLYAFDKFSEKEFYVKNIFEDTEKNIWIGTNSHGLFKFKEKSIFTLDIYNGLLSNTVCGITELHDGSIAVATPCKGLTIFDQGKVIHHEGSLGVINTCIWSVAQTRDNSLYIGTYGNGMYVFDQFQYKFYNIKQVISKAVFSMLEDRNNNFWVGTLSGLYLRTGDEYTYYDTSSGLAGNDIKAIYEAQNGDIWLAAIGGVTRYRNGEFSKFTVNDGLSHKSVRSIYEDDLGRIWFGTYGGGINIFDGSKFIVIDNTKGLDNNIVSAMIEDEYGRIWLTSNIGLSSVNKQDVFDYVDGSLDIIPHISYSKADGLSATEFNGGFTPSALKASDGTIWFPSIGGVAVVFPEKIKSLSVNTNLLIEEIRVDSLIIENPKDVIIDPEFSRIEIAYTSLSFKSPENIKFKTKIEGLDDEWSKETYDRKIYFNYLPTGDYTFRLKGTNSDGIWINKEASFHFIVEAKFYETILFYILLFVFLIIILSVFYYYRILSLRKRAMILQDMVNKQTASLQAENLKMEILLKEVKEAKSQIELQKEQLEELNAAKDTFFSVISHDLKNPFNSLLGYTEMILDSFNEFTHDEIKTFISEIRQTSQSTYTLLENLLQWANSQSGNLDIELKSVELQEVIKESLLLISHAARKKNITINYNYKNSSAWCDEQSISTVVRNLLQNAVKFTHEDGFIDIQLDEDVKNVFIVIRDSGVGISQDKLSKLFKLDSRKSTMGTNSEKGTGLGLIICKEFVDKNNGKISVSSEPGKGTEFIITLPKSKH